MHSLHLKKSAREVSSRMTTDNRVRATVIDPAQGAAALWGSLRMSGMQIAGVGVLFEARLEQDAQQLLQSFLERDHREYQRCNRRGRNDRKLDDCFLGEGHYTHSPHDLKTIAQ